MTHIKLTIHNINDVEYEKIILRKFFNMIFFSEDGKKLTIYTATVFGGMQQEPEPPNGRLVPTYCDTNCALRFQYETEDQSLTIKFDDLTDSFCKQAEYIGKVWGSCQKIDSQTAVTEKLRQLYPNIAPGNISMSDESVYYITEKEKTALHESVAACGRFSKDEEKYCYTLRSGTEKHDGLEYMNWIKSTISLPKSIFNKRIVFEIILEHGDNKVYYTPDFTWYFAPPEGYLVDQGTAEVDIGDIKNNRNYVQSVADDTTVHFREWENDELIDERKKVRVDLKEYTSAPEQHKLSDKKSIAVKLTISNPNHGANKQFFMGLLVAFLLAFCADKTRMNDFYDCLKVNCELTKTCVTSVGVCHCQRFSNLFSLLFPLVMLSAYISLIFRLKLCIPIKRKKRYYAFYAIKYAGIAFSGLLVFYTFGLWMVAGPEIMKHIIPTCTINWGIITILTLLGLSCNLAYIIYCTVVRKKKIFNNL